MALEKSRAPWGHLLVRILGLCGLTALVVAGGLFLGLPEGRDLSLYIALGGAAVVLLALLVEMRGVARFVFSRRGAAGSQVALQIALVTALVVGVNVYSFWHYRRFDWTADHAFTMPDSIRKQLADLRDDTDIVVYQEYVSFGQRPENKQDKYDLAAQRKIIDKVKDLAEQFQDLGPRFRVQVLDIQDDYYPEKLERIKREAPKLAEAIEQAPENSIFFYTHGRQQVQRLSFNDVYQLDKKESQEYGDGRGNLVLSDQGIDAFARKVFNIEQRRPRVGFAVVHEYLGQEGHEDFGMPGVKKVFANRGIDSRDIILKKGWNGRSMPEPTVLTHDENRYDILEAQRKNLERLLREQKEEETELTKLVREWEKSTLAELNKNYAVARTAFGWGVVPWEQLEAFRKKRGVLPTWRRLDEKDQEQVLEQRREQLDEMRSVVEGLTSRLDKVKEEQTKLPVDQLAETKRITDLRAKFDRMLDDIDLLVVPRLTILNPLRDERIRNRLHQLDPAQVEAIKDFIKAGKPVLFCLGPTNEPQDPFDTASDADAVEKLLTDFQVQLPPQTILFDVEAEAMADRSERVLLLGATPEAPPLRTEWGSKRAPEGGPQPIRSSLRLIERSFGKSLAGDMRLHAPRPVYLLRLRLTPDSAASLTGTLAAPDAFGPLRALAAVAARDARSADESAVFLVTDPEAWNEDQPFPTEKRVPQYKRPDPDDPNKGSILERRRGPFPVGIAFEAPVPESWYDKPPRTTPTVRLAVIGHGGVFLGKELTPMREKLLLDVSNWLLGRDDLLAHDTQTWHYPRVQLDDNARALWALGAVLGLPLLCLFVGGVVLLVRQMR